MEIREIETSAFEGQKPGTSGLRAKTSVFMQPGYLENFVQSIFDAIGGLQGKSVTLGGDGRYFNERAIQTILRMAAANGAVRVVVGRHGILSTPAASAVIRHLKTDGGIILSASHNPGGDNGDFGIKYNVPAGGPAPEAITSSIHARTTEITGYRTVDTADVDLSSDGTSMLGEMAVDVIDPVAIYADLMRSLFDFDAIRACSRPASGCGSMQCMRSLGPMQKRSSRRSSARRKARWSTSCPCPTSAGATPTRTPSMLTH